VPSGAVSALRGGEEGSAPSSTTFWKGEGGGGRVSREKDVDEWLRTSRSIPGTEKKKKGARSFSRREGEGMRMEKRWLIICATGRRKENPIRNRAIVAFAGGGRGNSTDFKGRSDFQLKSTNVLLDEEGEREATCLKRGKEGRADAAIGGEEKGRKGAYFFQGGRKGGKRV